MMLRNLFVALLFAVAAIPGAVAAPQAILKSNISVEGRTITLGDLFTPESFTASPEAARVVVAAAPLPGEQMSLDAYRLTKFCAEHGIEWPNTQKLNMIPVARIGDVVPSDVVKAQLLDAAAAQGLEGKLSLAFTGAMPVVNIPIGAEASVAVDALDLDTRTGQFRARLRAPADDTTAPSVSVIGRIYQVVALPVLTHDMRPGEVIAKGDFEWTDIAADRLGQNILTNTADLVGTTPKRMLRAGQAIRIGDVAPPIVIRKGDLVAMLVSAPGMSLTAQGRALDEGAAGDTIRIMNSSSKRTIEGTVKGPGQVVVGTIAFPSALASR